VDRFLHEAGRRGFAGREPLQTAPYPGRARYLVPRLRELWLHTNNSCNLACAHCLVSSGPDGDAGLDGTRLVELIDEAAEQPQAELCCPVSYDAEDTAHVPREVLERFYGCGGPMSLAGVREGETVVDLGSGAGIDVFIAARKVGPRGRAIGVDMTDPMLGVAGESRPKVAARLGYDVVEFRKGYLEDVPVEEGSADLVTSNCVINLSPEKRRVFGEVWRILRDHGRIVVSDIVADRPVPPDLKVNVHLWGECISGALAEDEFLSELERAGFYGVSILKKQFWKELEGYGFYSVTVRGYKFRKRSGCVFQGHRALYLGPYVSVTDEEGHLFPRGQPVEVCTDTLAKLGNEPYRGSFALLEPGDVASDVAADACCASGAGCC
jgi:ubiquinone/menaquinone biosynthesis C-methylase UbiE